MGITNTGKKDKDGNPVWRIEVYTGVRVGGEYQRVREYFHGLKKDAKTRMREIENDLAAGIDVKGGAIAFDEYAAQWLEEKKKHLAPRTYTRYRLEVERLSKVLGNTQVSEITAPVVRRALQAIRETPSKKKGGETLGEATVSTSYRVLRGILGQAVKDDLVRYNACLRVDQPKAKGRERRSMNEEQYRQLLEAIKEGTLNARWAYYEKEAYLVQTGHRDKPRSSVKGVKEVSNLAGVMLALKTGMRPSEIFALQWRHVDFKNGCIHVEQATKTSDGGIKPTKSEAGRRDIYLDAETLQYLAEWREFVFDVANSLGIELGGNSWVICSNLFTQVNHQNFTKWWNGWRKGAGFDGWELYELRHTQATLLLKAGVNVKDVQTRMGHSDPSVTLRNYAHASEDIQRNMAEKLPA